MSFDVPAAETAGRSDFEASTPRPIPTLESVGSSPLRFGLSYTVSPTSHRTVGQHRDAHPSMLRPRFLPLQRFASREEPLSPGGIPTHRLRCVPRVSHPLDALLPPRPAGLVSSRFHSWGSPSRLVSRGAVRPLERRTPPVFGATLSGLASPSGIEHTAQILHAGLGFSQVTAPLPPWDSPLRGFLLQQVWTELPAHLPSRAFPGWPRADLPVGAPGSQPTVAQPLSLEISMASLGFSTSSSSRLFRATPGLGYRFPSASGPRRRGSGAPLRPSSRSCRSSSRHRFR